MAIYFTGALLGRRARITFRESVADVSYTAKGDVIWCAISKKGGQVTRGSARASYMQLSDSLHFLSWSEGGVTVSHSVNTDTGIVQAFWSVESGGLSIWRAMHVTGTFEFI